MLFALQKHDTHEGQKTGVCKVMQYYDSKTQASSKVGACTEAMSRRLAKVIDNLLPNEVAFPKIPIVIGPVALGILQILRSQTIREQLSPASSIGALFRPNDKLLQRCHAELFHRCLLFFL